MQTELATPLSLIQINAAIRLQDKLAGDAPSARALDILSERLPAFDLESCLVKTAALNQLSTIRTFGH